MVKITVDGKIFEVEPGGNLLQTCLGLGLDIPYFCYHPAMGSVGACRQCAVKKYKDANDKWGRIIMSCMEPVADGLIISIDDPEVKDFRRAVIEALMTNHPHDCPVCDEGGECHLQDMTVMTGHNYRRFRFKKRTHVNQDLGPYINHEMNRCIQCYRCVRYYRDYAGGRDLHVFGSAANVYFGRHTDGKLESIFSGNLVEVCPTGVFTDKTLSHHYTRKWDLTNSPSVCNNCSVGCNIFLSERYGRVRRITNRYNHDVNGYFICDRGRFGYEYIDGAERIRKISVRSNEDPSVVLTKALRGKKIVGIGSPTASLESNFALETLAGKENFFHGVSASEFSLAVEALKLLEQGPAYPASLRDIESADAVFIIGEDPIKTAPMLGLAVRQAARNKAFDEAANSGIPRWNDAGVRDRALGVRSPLFIAAPGESELDDICECRLSEAGQIAGLAFAVAASIDSKAPFKPDLPVDIKEMAVSITKALSEAKNPVIITGITSGKADIIHAAANIIKALSGKGKKAGLSILMPCCNSLGLALMNGKPFDEIMSAKGDTLVILENDLFSLGEKEKIDSLLASFETVILLNHSLNATSLKADVLLPSGTFAESTGTIVSYEGRAQRYYRVLPEDGIIKDSWKLISEMISLKNKGEEHWKTFDEISSSQEEAYPFYSIINEIIPAPGFRMKDEKIARQTPRFSGRTAMDSNKNVHEPKPPEDIDSPLNFSMEGYKGIPPAGLVPYYWAPNWNSPQASNKYLNIPGGDYPDGNPGVRLFDGEKTGMDSYYKPVS
jgi:NADH-quinone oxidoreductase subunit G